MKKKVITLDDVQLSFLKKFVPEEEEDTLTPSEIAEVNRQFSLSSKSKEDLSALRTAIVELHDNHPHAISTGAMLKVTAIIDHYVFRNNKS